MDFSRIKTIRIEHLDFSDIVSGKTGNPIVEMEVPDMLKRAIQAGVLVIMTDPEGKDSCQLVLSQSGKFKFAPLP